MSELARLLKAEFKSSKAIRKHEWQSAVIRRHGIPTVVMLCKRQRCPIKWWPERNEPKGECTGWEPA